MKYIAEDRPDVDKDNFFALETSGSLSPQYVNKILRDTTAKLKEADKIFGHTDLRTTSIYLHSNEQELTDTIGL